MAEWPDDAEKMKINLFLVVSGLVALALSAYLNGFSATTQFGWLLPVSMALMFFIVLSGIYASVALMSDLRRCKRDEYIQRFMPYLFGLAILSFELPCRAVDALAVTRDDLAFQSTSGILTNPAWSKALPAHKVLTDAVKFSCPFCGKTAKMPAKKLMSGGSNVVEGGVIEQRRTVVRCKCGQSFSAVVEVFVPEPKVQLVPATAKDTTMTFNKPKLRAPSDRP